MPSILPHLPGDGGYWLDDALRDPTLSGAASVLLRAMDHTSGLQVGGGATPPATSAAAAAASASPSSTPPAQKSVPAADHVPSAEAVGAMASRQWQRKKRPVVVIEDMFQGMEDVGEELRKRQRIVASAPSSPTQQQLQQGSRKRKVAEKPSPPPSPPKLFLKQALVAPRTITSRSPSPSSREQDEDGQSLRGFFASILASRGRSSETRTSRECGYVSPPTPLQRASYGTTVLSAVSRSAAAALRTLLSSGLSRNPCSAFSDDILHMSCKRGEYGLVRAQLDAGCTVHVADDLGRTPLHHAAWAGHRTCFRVVGALLDVDPDLLRVEDGAGRTPLDFVKGEEQRRRWREFLESKAEEYWPTWGGMPAATKAVYGTSDAGPPAVRRRGAVPDPEGSLPLDLAAGVASGRVSPQEVARPRHCPPPSPPTAVSTVTILEKAAAAAVLPPPAQAGGQKTRADYFAGARMVANRTA